MTKKREARHELLGLGNTHLGPLIHTFSIPASITCPGATLACLLVCYALNFVFFTRTSLDKHLTNWIQAREPGFAAAMIAEIRWKMVKLLRIHVAGDFFSVAYIQAWIKVARTSKRTQFLFYSRSWRVAELRPHLIELASLPNVYAYWSEDRDTGASDMPVGRRCFLAVDAADEALVPPGVLVFREDETTPRKWVNGSWVCPKEQGTETNITCSSCMHCFTRNPLPVAPGERGNHRANA